MTSLADKFLEAALAPTRLRAIAPRARTPRRPAGLVRRYQTLLEGVNRAMTLAVARGLRPVLATATDGVRTDADFDTNLLSVVLSGLRLNLLQIVANSEVSVERMGGAIRQRNADELARVLPISISDQSPRIQEIMNGWRFQNVRLITSVAERLLNDVENLVAEAHGTGMRVETLRSQLMERFSVSRSRAQLIARDQILKANSNLTQERHREAGITRYVWVTSQDERVRPVPGSRARGNHRALHGQEFSWDEPPDTGTGRNHPGEDFQCRCIARPVL